MIRSGRGSGDGRLSDSRSFPGRSKQGRQSARQGFVPAEAAREAEAAKIPGLPARLAAAAIIGDVVQGGHRLDECFSPQAVPNRLTGLDPRDVALARSIATASLRRLGLIRHALAELLEKGLPRQAGPSRISAHRRRRAGALPRRRRSRRHRPRRARHQAGAQDRALCRHGQRRSAQSAAPARRVSGAGGGRRLRSAALARATLAQALWRGDGARHRRHLHERAAAGRIREIGRGRLGGTARRDRAADRIHTPADAGSRSRTSWLQRGRMVGAGRRRRAAGASPRRKTG